MQRRGEMDPFVEADGGAAWLKPFDRLDVARSDLTREDHRFIRQSRLPVYMSFVEGQIATAGMPPQCCSRAVLFFGVVTL